jgi:hypothetical protein
MQTPPHLQVEEIGGQEYADLTDAQRAALPQLADSLQVVIKELLERGVLVNINGKIIPNSQG